MKMVRFGNRMVDAVLLATALIGMLEVIVLMYDVLTASAKLALVLSIVAVVALCLRDVVANMTAYELSDDAEAQRRIEVQETREIAVNEPYNAPEWDITEEEDRMLDEYFSTHGADLFKMVSEPVVSAKEDKPRKLKCEYATNWNDWK